MGSEQDFALFSPVDRADGAAIILASALPDFDKNQRVSIHPDQVNFSPFDAKITEKYFKATT